MLKTCIIILNGFDCLYYLLLSFNRIFELGFLSYLAGFFQFKFWHGRPYLIGLIHLKRIKKWVDSNDSSKQKQKKR